MSNLKRNAMMLAMSGVMLADHSAPLNAFVTDFGVPKYGRGKPTGVAKAKREAKKRKKVK